MHSLVSDDPATLRSAIDRIPKGPTITTGWHAPCVVDAAHLLPVATLMALSLNPSERSSQRIRASAYRSFRIPPKPTRNTSAGPVCIPAGPAVRAAEVEVVDGICVDVVVVVCTATRDRILGEEPTYVWVICAYTHPYDVEARMVNEASLGTQPVEARRGHRRDVAILVWYRHRRKCSSLCDSPHDRAFWIT